MKATRLADTLDQRLSADGQLIDSKLANWHESVAALSPRLHEAVGYALLGPGKRLRATLCLWACDAAGTERGAEVWSAAMSLEMVHAYSLVHDDLPAMDDDDLRRGRASCHRQFDEATAILTGDALQTEAMVLLSGLDDAPLASELIRLLSRAIGLEGMAAGQQLDLSAADVTAVPAGAWEQLREIHRAKTGRLLGAALAMGARCGGVVGERLALCATAGELAGEAFQIQDDILDGTASSEQLGKSAGKDHGQGKLTAVRALGGVDAAGDHARSLLRDALDTLDRAALGDEALKALLVRFVDRRR